MAAATMSGTVKAVSLVGLGSTPPLGRSAVQNIL
jgi:hypothetical protein